MSGLNLGDTIKSMYITTEGMNSVGISTVQESIDFGDIQQNQMGNMNRQYGG
jgi:hypothetical protein